MKSSELGSIVGEQRIVHTPEGDFDRETESSVVELASQLRDRHGWRAADGGFTLEGGWVKTSSKNVFYIVRSIPAGERIVLKLGPNPMGVEYTDRVIASMLELADALDQAGTTVRGVRPIGWLASPSVIATTYLEGVDLTDLLRDDNCPPWVVEGTAHTAAAAAGMALATFHDVSGAPDLTEISSAKNSIELLARKLRLPRSVATALLAEAGHRDAVARRYGDFGPGNIRVERSGNIYVLDPPTAQRFAPRHRDMAHFEFQIRKILSDHGSVRDTQTVRANRREIFDAFVSGYAESSSFDPSRGDARALIAACQTSGAAAMAQRRMNQRRLRDTTWALAAVVALRREAIQAAGGR